MSYPSSQWMLILTLASATVVPAVCSAQGTFQITFDVPALPAGTSKTVTNYVENGMSFTPLPGSYGFGRRHGGTFGWPDNGSTYLQAGLGDSLAVGFQNRSLFGISSVDLAGYSDVVPDFTVNFVGYRPDGSTVTASFSGSGIDFQTYHFGADWASGLIRVEVPSIAWSLDNLVVSVPEPATGTLLVLGTFVFLFVQATKTRKRK